MAEGGAIEFLPGFNLLPLCDPELPEPPLPQL